MTPQQLREITPQHLREMTTIGRNERKRARMTTLIMREKTRRQTREMAMATELESLATWRRKKYAMYATLLVILIVLWYT